MPNDQVLSPDQLKKLLAGIDPAVLQQVMPLTGGVITMMFTDIVDSTRIKAEMGDQPFFDKVLKPHNDVIQECLSKHNGRELKKIGDAFLIGFADPEHTVACASEIQERLTVSPIQAGPSPLKVRIGLHTGMPKVYRDDVSKLIDLSGTAVDKAARVESLARGGQVLISEETLALAKPKNVHDWGPWELKGLGRHRIFEILWPGKIPERPVGHPWLTPVRFPTKFVGREKEIAEIMDGTLNQRLVTLRAMGGIGKTRLADEVAARVSQAFDDGIFIIELANTQNSEAAVVSEILARLNINPAGSPDEATAILTTLQNRRALVVLDNFEAVMSAATFVGRILKGCPSVHMLVTSQELLGLSPEQQIEVLPMATTAIQMAVTVESLAQLDSFKLFRERARLKKPNWDVAPREAPLVAEILELTDGIPLCIELAASWVDQIALAELRDGLKKNRGQYLMRRVTSVEEKRHASIQACIDWSFNLLKRQEKLLFPMLSVFVGGFFAEDVAEVCQTPSASTLLNSLREHSLLMWEESLGKTRYRMLPTVLNYAFNKLEQKKKRLGKLQQSHSQHFLQILDRADDQIRGKEQMSGIARVSADLENMRLGMETAIRIQNHQMALMYSTAFGNYLSIKGRFAETVERCLLGFEAARATNDRQQIAGSQINLGNAYSDLPTGNQGENLKKAIAWYEAALRVHTEKDFPVDWAGTQNNLGNAYRNLPTGNQGENLNKAIAWYEAALRVHTEKDFPVAWAMTQNNLGTAYRNLPTGDQGENLRKAIACHEAALRVHTEKDFPVDWAGTQNNLGNAYTDLPTGDREQNLLKAIGCYEAAIRGYEAAGLKEEVDRLARVIASLKS